MLKMQFKRLVNEYNNNRQVYRILFLIFCLSIFLRTFRLGDLLGFYYDQGRDALVIWDLWHKGKLFLIGPTTGLAGIFLGPLFYYLIAPFYIIGFGNPVFPAVFLGVLSSLSVPLLYYLGKQIVNRETGIIAAFIGGFSRDLVIAGRWLSNPTPLLFVGLLVFLAMWKILNKKEKFWWPILFLLIGISLQFEAASAVFYIPAVFVFTAWVIRKGKSEKLLPDRKNLIIGSLLFVLTLLPQIVFNFKHQNILLNNFIATFFKKVSFTINFWEVADLRLKFYWNMYFAKIYPQNQLLALIFLIISIVGLIKLFNTLKRNNDLILLIIFVFTPLVCLFFFQGNEGNIYDYYTTGIYNAMILLFAVGLGGVYIHTSKVLVFLFAVLFLVLNIRPLYGYLFSHVSEGTSIILANQKLAVDWVFADVNQTTTFNVDVYVPPVIPYTYDYLFLWRGTSKCGETLCGLDKVNQVKNLYTLYELDPPHPERLEAWLLRQDGIGKVLYEKQYGGVIVQRRERL